MTKQIATIRKNTQVTPSSPQRGVRFRSVFGWISIVVFGGAAVLQGCGSGMDAIDRRLEKVLGQSTARTGIEAVPKITPSVQPARDPDMYDGKPNTTNPVVAQLSFEPLDRGEPGTPAVVEGLNARLSAYARAAVGLDAPNAIDLSLSSALRLSQQQGDEYLSAEEDYIVSAIRLLIERHRWGPRLFADSTVTFDGQGDQGSFDNAMNVVNSLRATQQLPYGGQAEARWVWNATEQLRSSVSGQYRDSSSLILDANIPLLRGAGMVARESLIQSERDLVYAARDFESFRRTYFVGIAQDYFRLLQNINELRNRIANLKSLGRYVSEQEALYSAGRISQFKVNEARNDLVSAMSTLASSREQYTLALDRFKLRVGIHADQPVRLVGATINVSEPSTTLDEAAKSAAGVPPRPPEPPRPAHRYAPRSPQRPEPAAAGPEPLRPGRHPHRPA
ncbi:MAG: TolC family protein [Phycisphaerales bacterium]|nr:TolC family protein [Phycisphaerales bacterium]